MVSQNSCRKGAPKSNEQKFHSLAKAVYHPLLTERHTSTSTEHKNLGLFQKKPKLKPHACSLRKATRPTPSKFTQTHFLPGLMPLPLYMLHLPWVSTCEEQDGRTKPPQHLVKATCKHCGKTLCCHWAVVLLVGVPCQLLLDHDLPPHPTLSPVPPYSLPGQALCVFMLCCL